MSSTRSDGTRGTDVHRQSTIHSVQTYFIQNKSTFLDRGENTISVPSVTVKPTDTHYVSSAIPVFNTEFVRDGSILGYKLMDVSTGLPLLKIHFHGNTNSTLDRTFKAFFRSPVLKWDVENYGLFKDLPRGTNLGMIRDVYPDHRVFQPNSQYMNKMSRLEMQVAASLGTKYYLAVSGISEPIGQVDSGIVGRFAPRSENYQMMLRNCTREEAVLWLTMVIATDMKRRKMQTVQAGRIPIWGPNVFNA